MDREFHAQLAIFLADLQDVGQRINRTFFGRADDRDHLHHRDPLGKASVKLASQRDHIHMPVEIDGNGPQRIAAQPDQRRAFGPGIMCRRRGQHDRGGNISQHGAMRFNQTDVLHRVRVQRSRDRRVIQACCLGDPRGQSDHFVNRQVDQLPGVQIQQPLAGLVVQGNGQGPGGPHILAVADRLGHRGGQVLQIARGPQTFGIGHGAVAGDVTPGLDRTARQCLFVRHLEADHPAQLVPGDDL